MGIGDYDLGFWIGIGIEIGEWDSRSGIGDWDWRLGLGIWIRDWNLDW